jgi:hypothetical protein
MLLSLAAPPLSILLPNPLPPSMLPSVAASRLPFTSLRKSLRLLLDDTSDALDEVENDISFVYSGYAPISIRLVQCVAQKGGVLSNPVDKAGGKPDSEAPSSSKVQAHPIIGWKGFEDVLATIPGETFDFMQESQNEEEMSLRPVNGSCHSQIRSVPNVTILCSATLPRSIYNHHRVLFRWLYVH